MKIIFVDKGNEKIYLKNFAVYEYDESLKKYPGFIDIKKIIKEKGYSWLDDIQDSHIKLSKKMCVQSRWWLITELSRLEARPWGQEYIIKPILFARALSDWIDNNDVEDIYIIGKNRYLAYYLNEFNGNISLEGLYLLPVPLFKIGTSLKCLFLSIIKMSIYCLIIIIHYISHKKNFYFSNTLILHEQVNIGDSRSYFYGNLFNEMQDSSISFSNISFVRNSIRKYSNEAASQMKSFYLLDNIIFIDIISVFMINIYCFSKFFLNAFNSMYCEVGSKTSDFFWSFYMFNELTGSVSILNNICVYKSLMRIFSCGKYKQVVYPYEEKGVERAILFACYENNIQAIGYTPHPQHRLGLALRDDEQGIIPKPSKYAVCGNSYVDYFKTWGKKNSPITIWGSGKEFYFKNIKTKISYPIRVLFLNSHPNELRVFSSWLQSEKRLSQNISYYLRLYKVVIDKKILKQVSEMLRKYNCITLSNGSLMEDLRESDFAVFDGTSAGIVAIKHGFIGIHLCLDDFFEINPCFNTLDSVLSCESASQFADRIEYLKTLNECSRKELYRKQRELADNIFCEIRKDNIRDNLL